MNCLLCLESIDNFMDCIQVNSEMWNKQNIKYLIEKHLWPMKTTILYSSVCSDCGQELFTFHTFYKRIKKAHSSMSIMVGIENEKFMEDNDTNDFNDTTLENEEEFVSEVIYSDHFNDSSLDIKNNDDYMECNTEPEILQEQLISEKANAIKIQISASEGTSEESEGSVEKNKKKLEDPDNITGMLRQATNKSFFKERNNPPAKEDNSNLISSNNQEGKKGTPEAREDSLEKNKKQIKYADNITFVVTKPTNKSLIKEKNNPSAKEDNSNLISSNDHNVEKASTAQITESDLSIIKRDANNRKEANEQYDRIIAEHFKIKCNLCNVSLENFMDLRDHFEIEHKQCGYVRCCNRTYYSRAALVDHIYAHIKPDYLKCKVCDKVYTSRYNLIAHSKIHGDKSQLFKCDKCDKVFTTPSILKHHIESVHENKYVKICEVCGKTIRCPYSFAQHMKKHGPPTQHVSCDLCGKLYVNEKGLKRHKQFQHPEGGRTYHKCDVCDQLLHSTVSLKRHKLSQHPEGGKKEQKCPICSKVSPNPLALKQHIIDIHEKGYQYKCTMCERAFTRPRFLKEHLARHTGTALYTCSWCPKTFTASGNKYLHHKSAHPKEWQEHLRQLNAKKYNK